MRRPASKPVPDLPGVAGVPLLQLRKWLTLRHEWYERCLDQLSHLEGYGHLSRPMVQLCAHIGREPVRMVELARQMGVSRQWISRLAGEGRAMGLFELNGDPQDKRSITIGFSEEGWGVVRRAVARMGEIEAELARRIGRDRLEELVSLLSLDWGPAEIPSSDQGRRGLAGPRLAVQRSDETDG